MQQLIKIRQSKEGSVLFIKNPGDINSIGELLETMGCPEHAAKHVLVHKDRVGSITLGVVVNPMQTREIIFRDRV